MARRTKLIITLTVIKSALICYYAQVSKVPTATIATWALHDWVGTLVLVAASAIGDWLILLLHPSMVQPQTTVTLASPSLGERGPSGPIGPSGEISISKS